MNTPAQNESVILLQLYCGKCFYSVLHPYTGRESVCRSEYLPANLRWVVMQENYHNKYSPNAGLQKEVVAITFKTKI